MTFDIEGAVQDDYKMGYDALVKVGLSQVSENKHLRLPYSSVLGNTDVGTTAAEIRDALKKLLSDATGKNVERIVVAVIQDWACFGTVDAETWLKEMVTRFVDEAIE